MSHTTEIREELEDECHLGIGEHKILDLILLDIRDCLCEVHQILAEINTSLKDLVKTQTHPPEI